MGKPPEEIDEIRAEHRRLRLLELLKSPPFAVHGGIKLLAERAGKDASYVSRLKSTPDKDGHKRLGSDVEAAFIAGAGLCAGWFDLPLGSMLDPSEWGRHPSTMPPQTQGNDAPQGSDVDARMLHAHIDMLRKSAQIIAEQFGVSTEQVLVSALSSKKREIPGVDAMVFPGGYRPPVGTPQQSILPTMKITDWSGVPGESDPEGGKAEQERRKDERRERDRRAS